MGRNKHEPTDMTEIYAQAIMSGKERWKDFVYTISRYNDPGKTIPKVRKRLIELNFKFE